MSTVRTAAFYTTPQPPSDDAAMTRRVDAIAERKGYVSREAAPVRKKRWSPVDEPLDQLSFRCAITDINAFVELADSRNETFRATFRFLMNQVRAGEK